MSKMTENSFPRAYEVIARRRIRGSLLDPESGIDERIFDFIERVFCLEGLTKQTLTELSIKEGASDYGGTSIALEISMSTSDDATYDGIERHLRQHLPDYKTDKVSERKVQSIIGDHFRNEQPGPELHLKIVEYRLHRHEIDDREHPYGEYTYATRVKAKLIVLDPSDIINLSAETHRVWPADLYGGIMSVIRE